MVTAAADADGRQSETRCNVDTVTYDTHGRHVIKETDCLGQDRRALSGHNGWGQPTTVKRFLNTSTIVIAAVIGTAVLADSLAQGVPLDKAFLAGLARRWAAYRGCGVWIPAR